MSGRRGKAPSKRAMARRRRRYVAALLAALVPPPIVVDDHARRRVREYLSRSWEGWMLGDVSRETKNDGGRDD